MAGVRGLMTKQPSEWNNITLEVHKRDFHFLAKKITRFISEMEMY